MERRARLYMVRATSGPRGRREGAHDLIRSQPHQQTTLGLSAQKEVSAIRGNTPDLNVYWLSLPNLGGLCKMA